MTVWVILSNDGNKDTYTSDDIQHARSWQNIAYSVTLKKSIVLLTVYKSAWPLRENSVIGCG